MLTKKIPAPFRDNWISGFFICNCSGSGSGVGKDMDMAFIQDTIVSHATGRPKDVVRKERTENENKISKS
jgi:hypothetical protein